MVDFDGGASASGFDLKVDLISERYGAIDRPEIGIDASQEAARQEYLRRLTEGIYKLEWRPCPVCHGKAFIAVARRDRYGLPVQTCVCEGCGLVMTNPQMRDVDYTDFYENLYRQLYTGETSDIEAFYAKQKRIGHRILDYLDGHVTPGVEHRILEVGAGAGGTLEILCRTGASGLGIDLDRDYLDYGRRRWINLAYGGIDTLKLDRSPTLVVYRHVLEHLTSPIDELRKIGRISRRKQTHLYVEVPGLFARESWPSRLAGDFLLFLQNAHICLFSEKSLANVLHLAGFNVEKIDGTARALAVPATDGRDKVLHREDPREVIETLRLFEKSRP